MGKFGFTTLVEVKDGKKKPSDRKLTPDEEEFHREWLGSIAVIESIDDVLEFDGKVIHEGSGFTVGAIKGQRAGKPVCQAEITYRMLPYPNPEFRKAIRDWAHRLQYPFKEPV